MAKVKIKLNIAGLRALRNSEEVQKELQSYGDAAVGRLGDGYEADTRAGKTRAHCVVKTMTKEAAIDNAENDSIFKAVNQGK